MWGHLFFLASLALAGCGLGIALPIPVEEAPPAATPVAAPRTGYVAVGGVTVDICARCMWSAREASLDLRGEVRNALDAIVPLLPRLETRVEIQAARNTSSEDSGRLHAFAISGSGEVRIRLDLDPSAMAQVPAWLPPVLAHELHHAHRIRIGPGNATTLLEMAVVEGLADTFAVEVFPKLAGRWMISASPDTELRLWRRALRVQDRPFDRRRSNEWFRDPTGIPDGYLLGAAIVRRYLEHHPRQTAASLSVVPYDAIVEGSGLER